MRRCSPGCASASRPRPAARLRERVQAEHALAHVGHWQGRRARYTGTRKNLFDLRRVAVARNLHVIAREPDPDEMVA
jgi:transposase